MKFMLIFTFETRGRDEAIARLMWSDLMEVRIVPVVEDAELGEVLERLAK